MNKILAIILAIIMIAGAAGHAFAPEFYSLMIPEFVPKGAANVLAAIAELIVGIALLIPKYRKYGGLAFMGIMIAFMPLHIWDIIRNDPVMGTTTAAWIRFFIQALFIGAGWWVWDRNR